MNRSIPIDKMEYAAKQQQYRLLPFNFGRSEQFGSDVLLASLTGEFRFLPEADFAQFADKTLSRDTHLYRDLLARHFLYEPELHHPREEMAAQIRSKKAYVFTGPTLHAFVVTLRCDHSCQYCQVSRRSEDAANFDMSPQVAAAAIDRVFESSAPSVTIEFQGGEPLLAFPLIRTIVEAIVERNKVEDRQINFVIASTLHFLTDDILDFCATHGIHLSTSFDGPAHIHNQNRPTRTHDSYEKTVRGIEWARSRLGDGSVAALTTLTELSLKHPREIVDEYVRQGFHSIFLRPLSPYGFAAKTQRSIGYSMPAFLGFYAEALTYIIELNKRGIQLEESYAALLLKHILTPFSTGYVDLRSPSGAGLGALVYNYDGYVYPSDEARMLVEMGDSDLRLGKVTDSYETLYGSPAMRALLEGSMNEFLPGCETCVYQPYCGADPVANYALSGDPIGFRPDSIFCLRHIGTFDILFEYLHTNDAETITVFLKWLRRRDAPIHSRRTYL